MPVKSMPIIVYVKCILTLHNSAAVTCATRTRFPITELCLGRIEDEEEEVCRDFSPSTSILGALSSPSGDVDDNEDSARAADTISTESSQFGVAVWSETSRLTAILILLDLAVVVFVLVFVKRGCA